MRSTLISMFAVVVCLTLPSCLIGADSSSERTGIYVSAETLSKIEPGAKRELVQDLLGSPSKRIDLDDGAQIWKWSYKTETTNKGTVFLLVGSQHSDTSEGSTFVEFDADGLVVKTWRD